MRVGVGWESMVVYLRFILKWICIWRRRVTDRLGDCSRRRCGKCISYLTIDNFAPLKVWLHVRGHAAVKQSNANRRATFLSPTVRSRMAHLSGTVRYWLPAEYHLTRYILASKMGQVHKAFSKTFSRFFGANDTSIHLKIKRDNELWFH